MAAKKTTLRLTDLTMGAIGANPRSLSGRLTIISDRYSEILRRARVEKIFSEAELNALRDCCNGTWFEPAQLVDGAVLANFADSLCDGLAEKWGIDSDAVIGKLRGLSYSEQVALVENIEQFWRSVAAEGPDGPEDE